MARRRSAEGTRALSHVLICGGSLDDWKTLSPEGWSQLADVLTSALQSSGARWLTVCPYEGMLEEEDRLGVLDRIARALGGAIAGNRVSFIGRGGIVGIVDVVADGRRRFVDSVNAIPANSIDEGMIAASLFSPATDDPDLILVFGSPTRVPPALVWELAYGELVFLDTPWMTCNVEHVHMAVDDFQRRDRRFGGVDS
jgi:undecaprenyl pyrophosphate synthase